MVIAQIPDSLPEVWLRRGTEDLSGRSLSFGVRRAVADVATPDPVFTAPHEEADGDKLAIEANRGEIVGDGVAVGRT